MERSLFKFALLGVMFLISHSSFSQITERERPAEWKQLVKGARFMDRFLPMKGNVLSSDTWGADCVLPRYVDNGIEDGIWSYWGGNIRKGEDGKYHLFVCGWLECSPKGHMEWPNSYVFHTVSDNLTGPFKPVRIIGKGHNPEIFRAKDGRYVVYVIDGRYVSDDLNGKWEYGKFDFNARDRRIIEGLSNLSFAQREDSSYVMVCRGGGIWVSRDGLSEYNQLTDKRVYPDVDGRFEDPVIWRDHIQYHLIVNDWLGRIAFYLRSKDGVNWVVDPGEAYMPGIAVHADGQVEDWFKYERLKVYQDKFGRAIQANFAVIDTLKNEDKPFDHHSSKNISIPLNPGLLLTILDEKPITSGTKTIRVKIQAEEGFNPQTDIDVNSLRFGASEEVNYGRGCQVLTTENAGKDLIVTFNGKGNGITKDEFAPKLIGKYKDGRMLYGYARLPYIDYIEPILSARAPVFTKSGKGLECTVEVQNFGQVESKKALVEVGYKREGKTIKVASGMVPALKPYEKTDLLLSAKDRFEEGKEYDLIVTLYSGKKVLSTFNLKKKVLE
ncbi:glycoside hydrolase family protein [Bacteroides cellulosilyticus]|uniref:glycoside hydrolase family protein n=1 Tax=Bacteroides cellulosilyticus TaxID=246787 RepID=UPI0015F57B1B|nr:glycoside hydrolase family protein [Bacteroides cellulosilyticus]